MIAVDTSVVIAAFASWHEGHERSAKVLVPGVRLPAHCAVECYSVLTRLPPPHRVSSSVARDLLSSRFKEPFLSLDPPGYLVLLDHLVDQSIAGGAAYDALVGLTAARHGARLYSRDRRASRVYEALNIDFEVIS